MRCRDCTCPGSPHPDGDGVYLRPSIGLTGGLAAEQALLDAAREYPVADKAPAEEQDRIAALRTARVRPAWYEIFLRHGVVGWNLSDGTAEIPFDIQRLLDDYALARPAADVASDLYSPAILAPFLAPPAMHSRNGRTAGGIRPPSPRIRSRSRPSSPPVSGATASWSA